MAWDDEAEQLTLEVVGRLGVAALDGVYAQAIDDVQRSGLEVLVVEPESCRECCSRSHPARGCLPATTCGAYKARSRSLLAKPRLRVVPTEPNEQGGA